MDLLVIIIVAILFGILGSILGILVTRIKFNEELKEFIKNERKKAVAFSRAIIKGKITEQMYPLLPEFSSKYNLSDARFIGDPIDYVIFNGYTLAKDTPSYDRLEVVFIEVKTGNSQLSYIEDIIRKAIQENRVRFEVINLK